MAKEVTGVVLHAWLRTTIESSFTWSFSLGHVAVAVTARPCLPLLPDGCDDGCGFRGTALRAVAGCAGRGGRFVPEMPTDMPSSSSERSLASIPSARSACVDVGARAPSFAPRATTARDPRGRRAVPPSDGSVRATERTGRRAV